MSSARPSPVPKQRTSAVEPFRSSIRPESRRPTTTTSKATCSPASGNSPRYKATLDWSSNVPLEADIYTSSTTFDALNRPTAVTTSDSSVYRPTFNESNLLKKVEVNLEGSRAGPRHLSPTSTTTPRASRLAIVYSNNVKTAYSYDSLTFHLTNLRTTRPTDQAILQDLSYTYDPVGNITQIQDGASRRSTSTIRWWRPVLTIRTTRSTAS